MVHRKKAKTSWVERQILKMKVGETMSLDMGTDPKKSGKFYHIERIE